MCWEEVIPEDEEAASNENDAVAEAEKTEQPPRYEENDKYLVTEDVEFKAIWEKA